MRQHNSGGKRLHHPVVGGLDLQYEAMDLTADRGLTLGAYTAEPGSPSADALTLLAGWAATNIHSAAPLAAPTPTPGDTHAR